MTLVFGIVLVWKRKSVLTGMQASARNCVLNTDASIRNDAAALQSLLSDYRKRIIHDIQTRQLNIEAMTVFLSVVQESQELLSALRHLMRGENKIEE